jgi:hypothetical protein
VLAALLAAGFVANLVVRPLAARWFMKDVERGPGTSQPVSEAASAASGIGHGGLDATALLAWLAVGIPIAWGVWITLSKALVLFG